MPPFAVHGPQGGNLAFFGKPWVKLIKIRLKSPWTGNKKLNLIMLNRVPSYNVFALCNFNIGYVYFKLNN